jgi:hypothetical protein
VSEQTAIIDPDDAITIVQARAEWPAYQVARLRYVALKYPEVVLKRAQDGWPMLFSRRRLAERLPEVRTYRYRERLPPRPRSAAGEAGHENE